MDIGKAPAYRLFGCYKKPQPLEALLVASQPSSNLAERDQSYEATRSKYSLLFPVEMSENTIRRLEQIREQFKVDRGSGRLAGKVGSLSEEI